MILNWLHDVKPPKYLRYLFFIAYSWYRKYITHRGDAHFTAIAFLAMMHLGAYIGLSFLLKIIDNKKHVLILMGIVAIQFYFWFWHKDKWKLYIEEFKNINRRQQFSGVIWLFIYLFICLLPIVIPVFLSVVYDINLFIK